MCGGGGGDQLLSKIRDLRCFKDFLNIHVSKKGHWPSPCLMSGAILEYNFYPICSEKLK